MNRLLTPLRGWTPVLVLVLFLGQSLPSSALDQSQGKTHHFPSSAADKLETAEREQWQQPNHVIESLGVKPGDSVADIGAGGGYFSFFLAEKVGVKGKVYAVDIQQGMLDFIQNKIKTRGVDNISLIKSTETKAHLPAACCDQILMVNTWHELSETVAFMSNLRDSLKPSGKIAIINWKQLERFKQYSKAGVIQQMKLAGFSLIESYDFLEHQYFLVFHLE